MRLRPTLHTGIQGRILLELAKVVPDNSQLWVTTTHLAYYVPHSKWKPIRLVQFPLSILKVSTLILLV